MDINQIRNLSEIKEIIASCEGFGRTWGKRKSYFYGSHISFIQQNVIVLLGQERKKNGAFFISEFLKSGQTPGESQLKRDICMILGAHGIFPDEK